MSSGAYIYLLKIDEAKLNCRSPLKIGVAHNVKWRIDQLQTGCPYKISLVRSWFYFDMAYAQSREGEFHSTFSENRLVGEWFDLSIETAQEELSRLHVDWTKWMRKLNREENEFARTVSRRRREEQLQKISISANLSPAERRYRRKMARRFDNGCS